MLKRIFTVLGLLGLVVLVGYGIIRFAPQPTSAPAPARGDGMTEGPGMAPKDAEGQRVPLSLQVLLTNQIPTDVKALTEAVRGYHTSMRLAEVEVLPPESSESAWRASFTWGSHRVFCVGENKVIPREMVRGTLSWFLSEEVLADVEAHVAHLILFYGGEDPNPLEQYVALAAISGMLSKFGAVATLNLTARSSFPSAVLLGQEAEEDIFQLLRTLPLPALYCGFEAIGSGTNERVWLRTHGAERFGYANLAISADSDEDQEIYFDVFAGILTYCMESGGPLEPGDTLELDEELILRLRAPQPEETALLGEGIVLVCEWVDISPSENP